MLYKTDPVVVAPLPESVFVASDDSIWADFYGAAKLCKNKDSELRVPDFQETISIFINKKLLNFSNSYELMSGTLIGYNITIALDFGVSRFLVRNGTSTTNPVLCVYK